jgi:perosamine synthetase
MFDELIHLIRNYQQLEDGPISLHQPNFIGNEKKYVLDCIDSNFVSFEQNFRDYVGSGYAIATVNGSSALHMALLVSGVKENDLVITQPLSFVATCNAISYTGASPLFIDVDRATMGLSAERLGEFLKSSTRITGSDCYHTSSGRRIRACVPMHTFGHPCSIEAIRDVCDEYKIVLVEDAAESVGSKVKNKYTGTFGHLGCYSFNGNKTITAGGGGVIVTDDAEVARMCKHLTTQAKSKHPWAFLHDAIGYNYRMPNINAALVMAQLEQLDKLITEKRVLAHLYRDFFSRSPVQFIEEPTGTFSNYWLCTILFPTEEEQQLFLTYSNERQVMTRPVWELMTKLPMYKDCLRGELPEAEFLSKRLVNLPSTPNLNSILPGSDGHR